MKNIAFFLFVWLGILLSQSLLSQSVYEISNVMKSYEGKDRYCLQTMVETQKKVTRKAWEDYLNDEFDVKCKGKWELVAEEAMIPIISSNLVWMHMVVEESMTGSQLSLMLGFSENEFVDPLKYSAEFEGMKSVFNSFVHSFLSDYYKDFAKDGKKRLKKIAKKQKSLNKDNQKLKKELEKNLTERQELNTLLETSQNNLEETQKELSKLMEDNIKIESIIQKNNDEILMLKHEGINLGKNIEQAEMKLIRLG